LQENPPEKTGERVFTTRHRWECLLKQQWSITDYRLLTKENKLLFSVSICSKQMVRVVCHFCFPFAANMQKLPFSGTQTHMHEN
jgi:hypothetical protein